MLCTVCCVCVSGVDVWLTGCCVQFAVFMSDSLDVVYSLLCMCLVLMSGSLDVVYSLLCVCLVHWMLCKVCCVCVWC